MTSPPRLRRRPRAASGTWLGDLAGLVAGALAVFLAIKRWNDHVGLLVSIFIGAVVTVIVWYAIRRIRTIRRVDPRSILQTPLLGEIPVYDPAIPAPVLTDPGSDAAVAYENAAAAIASHTNGKVFLIASPQPGTGTTTAAINLAIAATQAGRRVLLIDGDLERQGLSRYGGSPPTPGLTELAAGTDTLQSVARMWRIGDRASVPVIPAGTPPSVTAVPVDEAALRETVLRIRNRADLVLVDSPPILWDAPSPLTGHADGTILVVDDHIKASALEASRRACQDAAAPLVGYVANRAGMGEALTNPHPIRRLISRGLLLFALAVVAYAGLVSYQLWSSWSSVDREDFDSAQAREFYSSTVPTTGVTIPEDIEPEIVAVQVAEQTTEDNSFDTYLIVGSDEGGYRADVIILILMPRNGATPAMVSIPRDLYLPNPCLGRNSRINAAFNGCGEFNGATMLSVALEDFTGVEIDHFALFTFEGFEEIIDGVGGVEICVDYRVKDSKSGLDLPAGCSQADGEQALAWVRSRSTLELVSGTWRAMSGVNDLARNQRQQDVILQVFSKAKAFDSPSELTSQVGALADAFTLSNSIGIGEAVDLAWSIRNIDLAAIHRLTIPIKSFVTARDEQVLLPTAAFPDLLVAIYPDIEFN